jgi:hypothetical protein
MLYGIELITNLRPFKVTRLNYKASRTLILEKDQYQIVCMDNGLLSDVEITLIALTSQNAQDVEYKAIILLQAYRIVPPP